MKDRIENWFYRIARLVIIILLPMASELKIPFFVFLIVTVLSFTLGLILYAKTYEENKKGKSR